MVTETSRQAIEIITDTLGQKRAKVYDAIKTNGGATLWQLTGLLNWPVNRISGRVKELQKLGFIKDSGKRKDNPASGRSGIVWVITEGVV